MEKSAQPSASPPSYPLEPHSFEELATEQGIAPVEDFEALIGRPSAEDESVEEFSEMLRAWRREGIGVRDSR